MFLKLFGDFLKVFGDIMVLASPLRPPPPPVYIDPDDVYSTDLFQIVYEGRYPLWYVSINNIKTRASREMTSRKNIKSFDFNGVNVAKHWHVAGRGICHL